MTTKKFIWDDEKPPVVYRPGTYDEAIIHRVLVERGDYMFPTEKILNPKVCFDVGGNIGIVAIVMATIYPSAKIYTFEPMQSNYELLLQNIEPYPNVKVLKYGLGGDSGKRRLWFSDDEKNPGGSSIAIKNADGRNEMVEIRDVASTFQDFGTPDILKIDVEGAEAEIFEAMPNLERVKWIAGELHGIRDFQVLDLLAKYFKIQCARNFDSLVWHFHALNRSWSESHGGPQNS